MLYRFPSSWLFDICMRLIVLDCLQDTADLMASMPHQFKDVPIFIPVSTYLRIIPVYRAPLQQLTKEAKVVFWGQVLIMWQNREKCTQHAFYYSMNTSLSGNTTLCSCLSYGNIRYSYGNYRYPYLSAFKLMQKKLKLQAWMPDERSAAAKKNFRLRIRDNASWLPCNGHFRRSLIICFRVFKQEVILARLARQQSSSISVSWKWRFIVHDLSDIWMISWLESPVNSHIQITATPIG